MAVHNRDIAEAFRRMADVLDVEGENPFRVRAYRQAAATLESLPRDVGDMVAAGEDLTRLPGVGEDLANKIREIVTTGHFRALEEELSHLPPGLADLVRIPGLGPKRVRALYQLLGIESIEDLKKAAEAGEVANLPGFGARTEARILEEIARLGATERRLRLIDAEHIANPLTSWLEACPGVGRVLVAGSFRRRKETVGDLDILVTAADGADVTRRFSKHPDVTEVLSAGPTRATVRVGGGFQVDLRVVDENAYGSAALYFTGSKAHNIELRKLAIRHGWKLNEYGLFAGERVLAGATEKSIYARLGLDWIPPVLRENRGEIEAAAAHRLPTLIEVADIRGDLHVHTRASDGSNTVAELVAAAKARGYGYIAITDHSPRATVAGGLSVDRLLAQIDEIDALNAEQKDFVILKGAEVDILPDGTLDYPDDILARLDVVVASVHSAFAKPMAAQTERIMRAMDNPHVSIIGHPTGRLINERPPYAVDVDRLVEHARATGCLLEINAQPSRLDLDDVHAMAARAAGVPLVISTDAHSVDGLDMMRFGVDQAQRAWLEPRHVANTHGVRKLMAMLKRKGGRHG